MTESANLIFIYGNDHLEINRKVRAFLAAFPDPTTAEMNITRLDGRTLNDDELTNAVHAMPFLASQRLVLLANPSARYKNVETQQKNADAPQKNAGARQKFIEFLLKVPPTTRLVMYEFIEDRRDVENNWLVKWAAGAGSQVSLIQCMQPRLQEMPSWVEKETRAQGGKIHPEAAKCLAEMVGENTQQAAQEITKLLTYVNYARAIELEDVEQVSVLTATADIFKMVDALGERDGRMAQRLLHRLLEDGDSFAVFGMIIRQFRLLLQAREILEGGGTQADIKKALHLHDYVAEKITKQARHFPLDGLERIYRRLLTIDYAAKSGEMPLEVSLETFVVELSR